jgi:hypothetical protein
MQGSEESAVKQSAVKLNVVKTGKVFQRILALHAQEWMFIQKSEPFLVRREPFLGMNLSSRVQRPS